MKTKKEVEKSSQEVSETNKSVSVDEYADGDTSDEEVTFPSFLLLFTQLLKLDKNVVLIEF